MLVTAKLLLCCMSNILRIEPERLRPPGLMEVMQAVEEACRQIEIDFYIVGAVARDILLTSLKITPRRMTTDVDLAVAIASEDQYHQIRTLLLSNGQFTELSSSVFALRHQSTGTTVDLMPFGAIADERWRVKMSGSGMEEISCVGFTEMAADALKVSASVTNTLWRVASVPGIALTGNQTDGSRHC